MTRMPSRHAQKGAALAVALVMLLIVTLLGLSSMRSTVMQERMTANQYDRSLAFQAAEAALRAAEVQISQNAAKIARDCAQGGVTCTAVPSSAEAGWQDVATSDFDAGNLFTGQPRYFVERMGEWPDPDSSTGFNQTANANQYGAQGLSTTAIHYRVTAQSDNPADAAANGRALVTLQSMTKQ